MMTLTIALTNCDTLQMNIETYLNVMTVVRMSDSKQKVPFFTIQKQLPLHSLKTEIEKEKKREEFS